VNVRGTMRGLATAIVLLLPGVGPVSAEDPTVTVNWQPGPGADAESLVLRYEHAPAGIEARNTPTGIEVVVDGASVPAAGLPDGLKAVRDGGSTRLRLDRPRTAVRSVRIEATLATIVFNSRSKESVAAAYTVGVGDVVAIAVYKNADLSGEFVVAPDGTLVLPLVGAVPVAGHTESDIAADLMKRLATDYLVDPQVSVTVKTYQSQFVYVTGAVSRSGRVAIRPGITLRGALAEAGAVLAPEMTVELRRATGETMILDAAALDAATAPAARDGDVLAVQQQNYVSIYGEVRHPNRLILTPGLTLLQSIAMAEGLTEWANRKKIQILRKTSDGTEQVTINLNAVESREVPDPPLKPEDVIIVGRRVL